MTSSTTDARTGSPARTATTPSLTSAVRRTLAYTAFEARTLLRNGEQILVAIVLPALALLGVGRMSLVSLPLAPGQTRLDLIAPGVLALAVVSSAFTSQAIATAFDRRDGVLRRLATTPLGRGGLLAGKVLAVLVVQLVQVVTLGGLALALGWRPDVGGLGAAVVLWLLGTAAFTAFGLLLAGTLRAEAVLALANLLWLLAAVAGAVVLPASILPAPLAAAVAWTPSGALGEGLRSALATGQTDVQSLAVLAGWATVLAIAVRRRFRWS